MGSLCRFREIFQEYGALTGREKEGVAIPSLNANSLLFNHEIWLPINRVIAKVAFEVGTSYTSGFDNSDLWIGNTYVPFTNLCCSVRQNQSLLQVLPLAYANKW